MSRIRTIKPEWLTDERMALASSDARVLSIALIVMADDYGRGRANRIMLAGQVFPGKNPETLANALDELATGNFVTLYEVDGQSYYAVRNWDKHQRVDKPGKPRVPEIPEGYEPPAKVRESVAKVPETLAPDHDHDHDQEGTKRSPRRKKSDKVPDPNHAPTVKLYVECFEQARGEQPTVGGKEAKAVQRLLKTVGVDKARRCIANAYRDPFWRRQATISSIVADPDKFLHLDKQPMLTGRRATPIQPNHGIVADAEDFT